MGLALITKISAVFLLPSVAAALLLTALRERAWRHLWQAVLVIGLACTVIVDVTNAAEQPNIVLFIVDDMGWQDTSVSFHTEVTPLNRRYHTPNMFLYMAYYAVHVPFAQDKRFY